MGWDINRKYVKACNGKPGDSSRESGRLRQKSMDGKYLVR